MEASTHYSYGVLEGSAITGDMRTRPSYDFKWSCEKCRPFKERAEGRRVIEAFDGRDMFVGVVDLSEREAVGRLANDTGAPYVFLPITNGLGVVLSTLEMAQNLELVEFQGWFVERTVMKARADGSLSSSRGFLPPAREYKFWEAHHPKTARRCWHAHDSDLGARQCAHDTGMALDGTKKGWYVRGCSPWRQLGTLGKRGDELREILDRLRIKSWMETAPSEDGEPQLRIEAMEWDDPRFVRLRERANWKMPGKAGNRWTPPPFTVEVRLNVDVGKMAGQAGGGAS
jgi:hypothetical protein